MTWWLPDATKDVRFSDNPLAVGEPYVRFYASAPLIEDSGHVIGTLCIIDVKPRPTFGADDRKFLQDIAALTMWQMEFHRVLDQ